MSTILVTGATGTIGSATVNHLLKRGGNTVRVAVRNAAKAEALEEARKILVSAQAGDDSKKILSDVDANKSQFETLAKANFDKAVAYVLERVIGKA